MSAAFTPDQYEAEIDAGACRTLWLAVLQTAIADASGRPAALAGNSNGSDVRDYIVRTARAWFRTEDFRTVCGLAGLDPEAVLAIVPTDGRAKVRGERETRELEGRDGTTKDTGEAEIRASGPLALPSVLPSASTCTLHEETRAMDGAPSTHERRAA